MSIVLGNDETVTSKENFTTNLVLSWLKTDFSLTNKRLVGFSPNTLFGVFPLGKNEFSYPLKNVASVGVSTKFHFKRFIIGLILVFMGLGAFDTSFFVGLVLLAVGALPLLNSYTSRMIVTNNAGQAADIEISILEKDKVQQFVNRVNMGISDIA
ncbi:hypothetical protein [Bacillus sp. SM2101]|uniref:hypothetical protein n=1 Tax=Bacillus sp. SM2101 TaxID=2805366 RepID=UPI001BDE643D|nr:hypothetical protein [Bacillus sp. SM2101]